MSRAKVTKDELDERREQVRRYLRQGFTPRDIHRAMKDHYEGYGNPVGTLWKDINAVRAEDVKAFEIMRPTEALTQYIGQLEELYGRAVQEGIQGEGMPKVKAIETAQSLAKDMARAKGVDRRLLGEGRDLTVRPGSPTGSADGGGDGESGWEEMILSLRRSRGLDNGSSAAPS